MHASRGGGVILQEFTVLGEPLGAPARIGELEVAGKAASRPELGLEQDFHAALMGQRGERFDVFGALHATTAEMDGGFSRIGKTVRHERDGIHAVRFQAIEHGQSGFRVVAYGTLGGEVDAALEEELGVGGGGGFGSKEEDGKEGCGQAGDGRRGRRPRTRGSAPPGTSVRACADDLAIDDDAGAVRGVFERVAVVEREVGVFARFERADAVPDADDFRGVDW